MFIPLWGLIVAGIFCLVGYLTLGAGVAGVIKVEVYSSGPWEEWLKGVLG